jgi:hypothetical protein
MGTDYKEADAGKDTGVSEKEATGAHHVARDDSGVRDAPRGERGAGEMDLTKGSQAEMQSLEQEKGLPESANDSKSD